MRKYRKDASSRERVLYGSELIEGLSQFEETRPLVETLEARNVELEGTYEQRQQKIRGRPKLRARLRFAEYAVDRTLRQLSSAAQTADGGRRGPLYSAVFPEGLTPIVAATGAQQIEPTEKFLMRFAELRAPGVEGLRDGYMPRVKQALDKLKEASNAYGALTTEVAGLMSREFVLREEHELQVIRTIGHVKALFPRDTTLQEVIFPPGPSTSTGDDEKPEGVEGPGAGIESAG